MPAARGVKRTASKASASAAPAGPKNKKKRNVVQLEVPKAPKRRCLLLTCGQGDVGQLGLGEDVMETTTFKQVTALGNKIVDAYAGGMHTIALDCDGKVWTFGCNDEGALGRPTNNEVEEGTPSTVTLPHKVVKISAGDSHSAALDEEGNVYAWGSFRDSHGSMGLVVQGKVNKPCKEPILVPVGEQAANIASGGDHLVILTISGAVYTMGCGEQGQLGRLSQRSATRDARGGFSALLTPSKVTLKTSLSNIWAGYHATFALDASGEHMYAWGLNNYSQLGITGEKHKTAVFAPLQCSAFHNSLEWTEVSPGQHHSLAASKGEVYCVGRCDYGRLGLGDRQGDAETLEVIPTLQNKTVISISAGTSNSFAVTSTGELYAWGMGSEGQLGIGSTCDASEPRPAKVRQAVKVSAGGQHTVVICLDPNAKKEPTPTPDEEMTEEKTQDEEEKAPAPEKKPRGRSTKQQKMQQDQEEEISSTSGAHASDSDGKLQKVNGDEKDTAMEVDETDKPQEKDDTKSKSEDKSQTQETEQKAEKMDTTDSSSQDTNTSEQSDKNTDNDVKNTDNDKKNTDSDVKNTDSDKKADQLTKSDEIKKIEDKSTEELKKVEVNGAPEVLTESTTA